MKMEGLRHFLILNIFLFTPYIHQVLDLQLGLGNSDVDYLTAKEDYCVSWDAMDAESGILTSNVSVCSDLNNNDCPLHSLEVGNQTSICISDIEFIEGIRYVTKVSTENDVGLSTELFSDGFVIDTTPPVLGEVIPPDKQKTTNGETAKTFTHSEIVVQWNGFWDKESGIRTSYVCVGTQPGQCNIKNFTDARHSTSYTFGNLPLVQGATYFASVQAENRAGLRSDVKSSDAIVVDKTGTQFLS